MRTIFYIAAAIYIAAASCAWAGTFDGLAAAASAKPPTPLFMQPGTIVKTEFKANIRPDSDADMEADFASVAQAGAKNRNQAQPKPAVAYRERRSGTMAPAPTVKQSDRSANGRVAAADENDSELEADLEKDLVLTPPPPKTEEGGKASREEDGSFGIRDECHFAEADTEGPAGNPQLVVMARGSS